MEYVRHAGGCERLPNRLLRGLQPSSLITPENLFSNVNMTSQITVGSSVG